MNKISDQLFRRVLAKTRQFTDESNGKEMVEFNYGLFRFLPKKSTNQLHIEVNFAFHKWITFYLIISYGNVLNI